MSGVTGVARITVMGAAATVLASLALVPAFDEPGWFWPGVVAVAFVAAVGFGLRQLGTPRLLVPPGQLAALGWVFVLLFAGHDLHFGFVPSGTAIEAFGTRVNDGLLIVAQYAAPVPGDPDLTMVTVLGVALVAIAVDALAATFRVVPWAGLPLLLLYSIPATTVSGGLSALAFVPPAIGYVLLLVSEGRERLSRWGRVIGFADSTAGQSVVEREGVSTSLLAQTGRRVGAAVIGLAVILPALVPTLPEGAFGTGPGGPGGSGGTIRVNNPIVDLKRDLELPDDVDVISYETDAKPSQLDYVRTVVLDDFNGIQWSPSQRKIQQLTDGSSELPDPPGLSPAVDRTTIHTRFTLLPNLAAKWLPVIYPTVALRGEGDRSEDWGYDPGTLDVVARDGEFRDLTYQVTSLSITHTAEDLAAAGAPPTAIAKRYTQLPGSLPEAVHQLARTIVRGKQTDYDQAIALQDWFRSEFTYDLTVRSGHGGSALMDFLNDKRGYCEQFSATMAIMARTLGIPARVAVGYLPGERIGDNKYVISAHDAHAWPELYFDGYGWVRFEPTPSTRTGAAPSWTAPESEAISPNPDVTGTPEEDAYNRQPHPSVSPPAGPIDPNHPENLGGSGSTPINPLANPLPYGIGGIALLLLLAPATVRVLVRRSRLSARNPSRPGRAEGGWRELAATVTDLGLTWNDAATPRATAKRLASMLPRPAAEAMRRVARAVEQDRYAPIQPDTPTLAADVREVTAALRRRASTTRRAIAFLLPPSLLRKLTLVLRPMTWLLDTLDTLGPRLAGRLHHNRRASAAHRT